MMTRIAIHFSAIRKTWASPIGVSPYDLRDPSLFGRRSRKLTLKALIQRWELSAVCALTTQAGKQRSQLEQRLRCRRPDNTTKHQLISSSLDHTTSAGKPGRGARLVDMGIECRRVFHGRWWLETPLVRTKRTRTDLDIETQRTSEFKFHGYWPNQKKFKLQSFTSAITVL